MRKNIPFLSEKYYQLIYRYLFWILFFIFDKNYESLLNYLRLWQQESIIISIMLRMQKVQTSDNLQLSLRQIQEGFLSTNGFHMLKKYTDLLQNQIQIRKENVLNEIPTYVRGRGGNNIAQNVKKSLLSVFRKNVPKELFIIFQEQCVKKHELKSQKENILIFFLYLYKFHIQGQVTQERILKIEQLMREKIEKYINNSRQKMEIQPGRHEFHSKNIREFQKFLALDLNFRERKTFNQVAEQLRCFYLRKHVEFTKAVQRFYRVIKSDPILTNFFIDQGTQYAFLVKEEPLNQQSPLSPTASIDE